jgi:hypothetical protein
MTISLRFPALLVALAFLLSATNFASLTAGAEYASHPPIRPPAQPSARPKADGPARFVDPAQGDDAADGSEGRPWRTINHALPELNAGDTLYLRGGPYYENVYCAVAGENEKPITVRSYPGELAVIDGGFPEFQQSPQSAWEPVPKADGGVEGEYRSTKAYKNIRDVVGSFGDSDVGLQTYWHVEDLRAENEQWIDDPEKKQMVLPVYCGPGLWYHKPSGRIHVRLAHTHNPQPAAAGKHGVPNYTGETDPRKLRLVIAPFDSEPLFVDQGMHVRFQDLSFRGGGFNTVVLQFGVGVEFDNCVILAGTYGIRARSTGPLRMVDSAVRGIIPPWSWRNENSLYTYSPDAYDPYVPTAETVNRRNIARLPTHALVVTEGSYEFEVFHYPYNHDWDVSNCEFTDAHDGFYASGRHIRFHHNWVDNIQDDGIYLSAPSPYFNDDVHIYQNLITQTLSAIGCNKRGGPGGSIYLYRNVVDMRRGILLNRPNPKTPEGAIGAFNIFLTHGGELLGIESLHFYQNTLVFPSGRSSWLQHLLTSTTEKTKRRVFNNLLVYLEGSYTPRAALGPRYPVHDVQVDGNLHWSAGEKPLPDDFLNFVRQFPASLANKTEQSPTWEAAAVLGDPKFVAFDRSADGVCDFRIQAESAARKAGIVLPAELEDSLRPTGGERPDIGAVPHGVDAPRYGRGGRITGWRYDAPSPRD